MKISIVIIGVLIFFGCQSSSRKRTTEVFFNKEDLKLWNETDSFGCYLYRREMLNDNKLDYKHFIGSSAEKLKMKLGVPDFIEERNTYTVYYYKIDCKYTKGHQSKPNYTPQSINGELLVFFVNSDSAIKDGKYIILD